METAAVDISATPAISVRNRISAFVELTKPRIALMLVLSAAAGFYLASRGGFDGLLFVNSIIGIALLAFGVATLNQYLERHTDSLMDRTATRPLPTGRIQPGEALVFGAMQCTAAEVYLYFLVNPLTAFLGLSVVIGYVLVYTPLKTRTTASTAIGAIPGAMPPLMGWTSAANEVTLPAWALFAFLFLWQFPHFFAIAWLYREQYGKAGILMLPVVESRGSITARQIVMFTLLMAVISVAPYFLGVSGPVFLIGTVLLGILFMVESVRFAVHRTDKLARRLLLVSVAYLPLVFLLAVLDRV